MSFSFTRIIANALESLFVMDIWIPWDRISFRLVYQRGVKKQLKDYVDYVLNWPSFVKAVLIIWITNHGFCCKVKLAEGFLVLDRVMMK